MSDLIKTLALVLHSIRWKESSKIVTLYTRERGIIKVIARGVYRPKNPFAGLLESLNLLEIVISSRSTRALQILTQADLIDPFNALRLDMNRLPYALAILELLDQTMAEDHGDALFFDFSQNILRAMQEGRQPILILLYFLLKLTSYLGFKPNFGQCSMCATTRFSSHAFFSLEKGSVYCSDCAAGAAMMQKLSADQVQQLAGLQKYPHHKIAEFTSPLLGDPAFIVFLLEYLNFHMDKSITLRSLSMIT